VVVIKSQNTDSLKQEKDPSCHPTNSIKALLDHILKKLMKSG